MSANPETGLEVRPTGSRLDLINATISSIAEHGLSALSMRWIACLSASHLHPSTSGIEGEFATRRIATVSETTISGGTGRSRAPRSTW